MQVFSDRWRAFLEAYEKVLNSEIKYQALLCDMHHGNINQHYRAFGPYRYLGV